MLRYGERSTRPPPRHGVRKGILNRSARTVSRMLDSGALPRTYRAHRGYLSREVVEALALTRWSRRRHKPGGYWATATEAAEILGVNRARIGQLVAIGRLPELRTPTRRRLYRRAQIEVIANARRLGREGIRAAGDTEAGR